jgi:hypothetical protein
MQMSDDNSLPQLFATLLTTPLLPHDAWENNRWHSIDRFKCVTNLHEHVLFYVRSQPFALGDDAAYRATEQQYRQRFWQIVDILTKAWGSAASCLDNLAVHATDDKRRLEQDIYERGGLAFAYWCKRERVAYIELEHQRKEFPLFLLLGTRAIHVNYSICSEQIPTKRSFT